LFINAAKSFEALGLGVGRSVGLQSQTTEEVQAGVLCLPREVAVSGYEPLPTTCHDKNKRLSGHFWLSRFACYLLGAGNREPLVNYTCDLFYPGFLQELRCQL
jgi:hypothetical protein